MYKMLSMQEISDIIKKIDAVDVENNTTTSSKTDALIKYYNEQKTQRRHNLNKNLEFVYSIHEREFKNSDYVNLSLICVSDKRIGFNFILSIDDEYAMYLPKFYVRNGCVGQLSHECVEYDCLQEHKVIDKLNINRNALTKILKYKHAECFDKINCYEHDCCMPCMHAVTVPSMIGHLQQCTVDSGHNIRCVHDSNLNTNNILFMYHAEAPFAMKDATAMQKQIMQSIENVMNLLKKLVANDYDMFFSEYMLVD